MPEPSLRERLRGGLLGLLVGDALGVPYEFHDPERLPQGDRLDMEPPPHFPRAHRGVPPGTWSDDGAQALALLASLLDRGALDLPDFAHRLLDWRRHGYMAPGGRVFDVGLQTQDALYRLAEGIAPERAGPSYEDNNGNGSLMRALPLALWHTGPDADLVRDAHRQSLPTHGHPRSQACCALYCLWARRTLEGVPDAWEDAVRTLRRLYADGPDDGPGDGDAYRALAAELEAHVRPDAPAVGVGTPGYVVATLHAARWAVAQGPYERAVRAAVSLGYDTDTVACVAGGIAGLRDGAGAIPARWRAALRGADLYEPLLARLLERPRP